MSEMKILVVEDDRSVANLITTTLKIHHYQYVYAGCGTEAISLCASHHPEMILMDLGLPDMDGIQVLETVRKWSSAVIIVISARGEDNDKIEALDAGADDYLTKPFSVDELLARIRAAQRRMNYISENREESPVFINGNLAKELCTNTIATYVRAMGNQIGAAVTVHSIAGGQAVAIEFIVDATTKNTGRPLKEIRLKKNILVASITHGRNIIFPNGESVFRQGDRIIIVSNGDAAIHHLNDIFVS